MRKQIKNFALIFAIFVMWQAGMVAWIIQQGGLSELDFPPSRADWLLVGLVAGLILHIVVVDQVCKMAALFYEKGLLGVAPLWILGAHLFTLLIPFGACSVPLFLLFRAKRLRRKEFGANSSRSLAFLAKQG